MTEQKKNVKLESLWAVRDSRELSITEKSFLYAVVTRGVSKVTRARLCRDTKMGDGSITRTVASLTDKGLIKSYPGRIGKDPTWYEVNDKALQLWCERTKDPAWEGGDSGEDGSQDVDPADAGEDSPEDTRAETPPPQWSTPPPQWSTPPPQWSTPPPQWSHKGTGRETGKETPKVTNQTGLNPAPSPAELDVWDRANLNILRSRAQRQTLSEQDSTTLADLEARELVGAPTCL